MPELETEEMENQEIENTETPEVKEALVKGKDPEPIRERKPGEGFLSFSDITTINSLKYRDLFVEEWDGWVRIQELNGIDRDAYEFFNQSLISGEGENAKYETNKDLKALLVQMSLVDEKGEKVFSKKKIRDLQEQSGIVITRIFVIAQKLSKLRGEDLKEYAKNLSADPNENGGSISPTVGENQ